MRQHIRDGILITAQVDFGVRKHFIKGIKPDLFTVVTINVAAFILDIFTLRCVAFRPYIRLFINAGQCV